MFVTVRINTDIQTGTLVCHDINNVWRVATSSDNAPLGVIEYTSTDEFGQTWGRVILAGPARVMCGAIPPAEGGWLACDDQGRAIVGTVEDCGLIAPQSQGQTEPAVGDLILVYIR